MSLISLCKSISCDDFEELTRLSSDVFPHNVPNVDCKSCFWTGSVNVTFNNFKQLTYSSDL